MKLANLYIQGPCGRILVGGETHTYIHTHVYISSVSDGDECSGKKELLRTEGVLGQDVQECIDFLFYVGELNN